MRSDQSIEIPLHFKGRRTSTDLRYNVFVLQTERPLAQIAYREEFGKYPLIE